MKITENEYKKIEQIFPKHRRPAKIDNITTINAILYNLNYKCGWRSLPPEFGNWHTIYTKMNRWSKNGILQKIFLKLQQLNIIKIDVKILCILDMCDANKQKFENDLSFIWSPHLMDT